MTKLITLPNPRQKPVYLAVVACAVAVVAAVLVSTNAADNSMADETIEGELVVSVEDDLAHGHGREAYAVKLGQADYHTIDTGGRPIRAQSGSKIRVHGQRRSQDRQKLIINPDAANAVEVLAAPADVTATASAAPTPTPDNSFNESLATKSYNLAVILVDMRIAAGTTTNLAIGSPLITPATASSRYFTATRSVRNYFRDTTQQRYDISGQVAGTATITLSGVNATTCNYNSWADLADSALAQAGISLAGYDHKAYLMPVTDDAVCTFSGVANVGGARSWYKYAVGNYHNASGSLVTEDAYQSGYAHEIGHNLGLRHANALDCTAGGYPVAISTNCTVQDYGDPFDIMGVSSNYREMHGTHRNLQMQIPDSAVLNVTTSGTYTLSPSNAYAATPNPKLIRLAYGTGTLDLEYRQNNGGLYDTFSASSAVVNGLSIRRREGSVTTINGDTQLIDATPATSTNLDAPLTSGSYYDPDARLSIRIVSRTPDAITFAVAVAGTASEPPLPSVTSVTPASAPVGSELTIRGSGFSSTGVHVRIDGTDVIGQTVVDDTTIRLMAPSHVNGAVAVDAVAPWGSKRTLANGFTYTSGTPIPTPAPTPTGVIGDINGDSRVNVFDLSTLLAYWNTANQASDLKPDGIVNVFDLAILLGRWTG